MAGGVTLKDVRRIWHWTLFALLALVAGLTVSSFTEAGAHPQPPPAAALTTQRPAAPAACTDADLAASYRTHDAAMSHVFGRLKLTNVGDHACVVRGYGGLSYVRPQTGQQVGAAADRTPGKVAPVLLAPGQWAVSAVTETSFAPYPKKECKPTRVAGFRVYVPDATAAQFVRHKTTGCANAAVHLLSHKPYRGPRG